MRTKTEGTHRGGDDAAVTSTRASNAVLDVENLTVRYKVADGYFTAVDNVSFRVAPGEQVAIVGESGSGKTNTCLAIAGVLTHPNAVIEADAVTFQGTSIAQRKRTRLPHRIPGLAMVFQDASTSLDPVWTVGSQLIDILRATQKISRKNAKAKAAEWLRKVGMADPERVMKSRPYELSGGMRQRVMVALALAGNPRLLIADEPTSARDATLSVEIMQLLVALTTATGTGLILVTHDIHLGQAFTERMLVMYGGRIVEEGPSSTLDTTAVHPYTQALMRSVPTLESAGLDVLPTIPISATGQHDPAGGCSFLPRCDQAHDACAVPPQRTELGGGYSAACWLVATESELALTGSAKGA
jgi:oligopeptide/dipeptide ABC transporter ATP-binding protein